jgi:peroxiredoxin
MKMKLMLALFLLIPGVQAFGQAQVPNFTLTDVAHGSQVSLEQFSAVSGVVVIFTSNVCPYDLYYTERLKDLIAAYAAKVPFLLVNSHLNPEENEEQMKALAATWNFSVPYLSDKEQSAMDALGAKRSPEVFVLKRAKGNFTIFYNGALDDNAQEPGAVTSRYLKDAIENLLGGKPVGQGMVRAVGCSIRRK